MARIYTDEMIDFVREIAPGRFVTEIADLFNAHFGLDVTPAHIQSIKRNHGIKSDMRGKQQGLSPGNKIFTPELESFITKNYKGISNKELADLVNTTFGLKLTAQQVKSFKKRKSLDSGLTGHFEKGKKAYNKGLKQTEYMSREAIERTKATRFKKGVVTNANLPCPLGHESINTDGYIRVKVSDKGSYYERWKMKHRIVWEEHYGPIPDGKVIVFIDQNPLNCDIANMKLVSKATMISLNRSQLMGEDPVANEVAINISQLAARIGELTRET